MPLPFKKDKRSAASYVIRRLKGSDSYENLKDHNELNAGKVEMGVRNEPESNYDAGLDQAVDELMMASERKDVKMFKNALYSFVQMVIDKYEEEEDMFEED